MYSFATNISNDKMIKKNTLILEDLWKQKKG